MRLSLLRVLLVVVFCSSFVYGQQAETAAPETPANTATASKDSQVTVYIYRYKQFVGSALSPSVYCDEGELARMENGRFFAVKLPAGKHTFRSNDKQSGIEVDLKSGQDYYVRVEIAAGMMKGHGRLVLTAPEQGSYETKKLKPLDRDKVKDNDRVITAALGENK
jgi:hypothetical protein